MRRPKLPRLVLARMKFFSAKLSTLSFNFYFTSLILFVILIRKGVVRQKKLVAKFEHQNC